MKRHLFIFLLLLKTTLPLWAGEISWDALKGLESDPKTKTPLIKEDLKKLLKKEVTIKGFMMPLDFDAKSISEFLFMPYLPACQHVPPPPANQVILVKMKKGANTPASFYPVELTGNLTVEANKELDSGYKMEGLKVKELKQ
ncbi:MAG: DUF3299 domain-containing protein [Bacteriovorax sp.]|nr:DUF3299 domain-containing protein [Bacteriovorax sp.]